MFSSIDFYDELHSAVRDSVTGWAEARLEPGAAARDASAEFDAGLYSRMLAELGLANITVPEALGGQGLDVSVTLLALEGLSAFDPAMAMSYLAQELLFTHQLCHTWADLGVEMPARHADVIRAAGIAGMAMSEPNAGTDVLGMSTTAVADGDGGFVLNGVKQWITNATVADYVLVYARTGEGRRDVTLFLVGLDGDGVTRTACEPKMGMRASPTGVIHFRDCRLPADAVVGRLHGGLAPMIRNLAVERLGLAAQAVGIASRCVSVMTAYASERRAFGRTISEFGQIQRMVAGSYASSVAMRAVLYDTAAAVINGAPDASVRADAAKLFCTSAAERVSRDAIQVLGANGYTSAYPVERLHRDAVLLSIGGGTDEALQKNITRQLTGWRHGG